MQQDTPKISIRIIESIMFIHKTIVGITAMFRVFHIGIMFTKLFDCMLI